MTRSDTDGRELTDERRCAPTSVHVPRNRCSRSPESVFTFSEIPTWEWRGEATPWVVMKARVVPPGF